MFSVLHKCDIRTYYYNYLLVHARMWLSSFQVVKKSYKIYVLILSLFEKYISSSNDLLSNNSLFGGGGGGGS